MLKLYIQDYLKKRAFLDVDKTNASFSASVPISNLTSIPTQKA